jgi:hypothetical protein
VVPGGAWVHVLQRAARPERTASLGGGTVFANMQRLHKRNEWYPGVPEPAVQTLEDIPVAEMARRVNRP